MSIIALRGAECWYYFEIFFSTHEKFSTDGSLCRCGYAM